MDFANMNRAEQLEIIKAEEARLRELSAKIDILEAGGTVENLTLEGAYAVADGYEATLAYKRALVGQVERFTHVTLDRPSENVWIRWFQDGVGRTFGVKRDTLCDDVQILDADGVCIEPCNYAAQLGNGTRARQLIEASYQADQAGG